VFTPPPPNPLLECELFIHLYLYKNYPGAVAKNGTIGSLAGIEHVGLRFPCSALSYRGQLSSSNRKFMKRKILILQFIFTCRAWDVPKSLRGQEKYQNISGNLLFCDCHAMYFKRWLSRHPVIEVSCYEPQKLRGAPMKTLTRAELEKCCK
jgi:hypothetical protein